MNKIRAADIPTLAQGPFAPGNVGYLKDAGFPDYDAQKAKDLVAKYKPETGNDLTFTAHPCRATRTRRPPRSCTSS